MASSGMGFGEILRSERERKGIDINTTARTLRIRPDILEAIEACDFAKMPPQGYTKNMVNAYARYLGLNATDLTRRYLDEAYAYEVGRARNSASFSSTQSSRYGDSCSDSRSYASGSSSFARSTSYSNYDSGRGRIRETQDTYNSAFQNSPRSNRERFDSTASSHRSSTRSTSTGRVSAGNARDYALSGSAGSHGDYNPREGVARSRNLYDDSLSSPSYGRSAADSLRSAVSRRGTGRSGGETTHRTSHTALNNSQYNFVAGASSSPLAGKLPFIIAAIAIILVIIIAFSVVNCKGKDKEASDDLPNVPVTGLTDPEAEKYDDEGTAVPVQKVPPTFVEFAFYVYDGQNAYVEVYQSGSDYATMAEVVPGGTRRAFDVTDTLRFVTTNPEGLVCKLGGQELQLTDADGLGVYSVEVNFQDYLNQWKTENGVS